MMHELDTTGLNCPYPLAKAKAKLRQIKSGEKLRVISTDPGSEIDFKVFAEVSANISLRSWEQQKGQYIFVLEKN